MSFRLMILLYRMENFSTVFQTLRQVSPVERLSVVFGVPVPILYLTGNLFGGDGVAFVTI